MKLIKPSFEIIEQGNTLNDVYKHIELCGRTCYKSADKITEDSAKPFVDRMIKSKHYAMLEHGTIYLKIPADTIISPSADNWWKYYENKYSTNPVSDGEGNAVLTTNLRVLIENDWEDDLQYICESTDYHPKRITVRFICDNGVAREFCRHRVFSFAQESTRYCNYSKNKFNNELTFIEPCWCNLTEYPVLENPTTIIESNIVKRDDPTSFIFRDELENIEKAYLALIENGWKAEQARNILPLSLKTELIMTGFIEDWKHFFELRAIGTTGKPHPQAQELALPLMEEFVKRGYIK